MAAESGSSSNVRPINWTLQAQQRVMSLQCAIAMSLGIHPSPTQLKRALQDKSIQAAYGERKVLLGRKLSPTPGKGLVTILPSHNLNLTKTGAIYRIVDVVSCIEVLAEVYPEQLSPEFLALKASLLKLDLPSNSSLVPSIGNYGSSGSSQIPSEKRSKNQNARNATLKEKNMNLLLYATAHKAYGFNPSGTKKEYEEAISEIYKALESLKLAGYGLGPDTIRKILFEASNHTLKVE